MRYVVVVALLIGLMSATASAAAPSQRDMIGAGLIVQAQLEELEAPAADIRCQANDTLDSAFPGHLFVLASFGDVAPDELPSPLTPNSLFVVPLDGTPQLLATAEDVLELFKNAFKPIGSAEDAKRAAAALLALEQAKYPNQPFATKPDDLKATPDGNGGFVVIGSSEPTAPAAGTPNGSGPISVTINIGPKGQPASITITNKYRLPARRLVTPTDIAADTTAAQNAAGVPVININSPTINKLFPGHVVFRAPAKKGKSQSLVVVDPNGVPHVLNAVGPIFHYVKKHVGKLTSEQQARNAMKTFLTLVMSVWPNQSFDPVQDSDITVKPGDGAEPGGMVLTGRITVSGHKKKYFQTTWHIGPAGGIYLWKFSRHKLGE